MTTIISPDIEATGYHKITLPLNRPMNPIEIEIVRTLEGKLKNNGFFFTINNFMLIFHFHTLDFEAFRDTISQLLQEYHDRGQSSEIDCTPFAELVSQIDNIRSYGVKGGKRVYVDYNLTSPLCDSWRSSLAQPPFAKSCLPAVWSL